MNASSPMKRRDVLSLIALVALVWLLSQGAQAWLAVREGEQLRGLAREGDILMLSSRSCGFCDRARQWLTEERVPFRECLIESDASCAARYQATMARGTPTFLVKGRTVLGWNRAGLIEALQARSAR